MTQHCTITGTMLVPVHYIICTLKIVIFPEITVFVVVKIKTLFSVSVSVSIPYLLFWIIITLLYINRSAKILLCQTYIINILS